MVSIPLSDDPDEEYSKCEVYALNFTGYSDEEFINWNRSEMINGSTPKAKCSRWVYDRHEFVETLLSRVGSSLFPKRLRRMPETFS